MPAPFAPLTLNSPALREELHRSTAQALAEDIGSGDLTASLCVDAVATSRAVVITRQDAILAGAAWFDCCLTTLDPHACIQWLVNDGDRITSGQQLCLIEAKTQVLLSAERSALNFLQLLSAVATQTRHYVNAIIGMNTHIVDTRKTIPGLRLAQKYAVACGGGHNHRIGLFDMLLIKENHIQQLGGVENALACAQRLGTPGKRIQIEVESLKQLQSALHCHAEMILLDNMTPSQLREAVLLKNRIAPQVILEASGNVSLDTVRQIAMTGVERISIGALTKDIQAIDYSMRHQN